MRLLQYKDLDLRRVGAAFEKVRAAIEADDFRSADVKKLHVGCYYRAKLDYSNRLLLQFSKLPRADGEGEGAETVCLALEVIENHVYERSRFLRGAKVDEAWIERAACIDPVLAAGPDADVSTLRWLAPGHARFELLERPLVFDDAQDAAARHEAPLVIVGSAGSGKTAVTLSRLREVPGRVLYVTLSAYLARSAQALHGAHGYDNPAQQASFLSYGEFLATLRVPEGREVGFDDFSGWLDRHRAARRALADVDSHALFEEFRGVLGARPEGPLELAAYLALGPRQSLLAPASREAAHLLFGRYRQWLRDAGLFDTNLVAHEWRGLARPVYDFLVVDEVQDLTAAQLALLLACLKTPGQFLLCGDANQVVHPNFFSWAAVKALFWHGLAGDAAQRGPLRVLRANFRNTRAVNELANALLKLKTARFGAVDRETHFLVQSVCAEAGRVSLVREDESVIRRLDAATSASTRHAVIVLRDEDKPAARTRFGTPLVFSVRETKGLEYPHVVLAGLVSGQSAVYAEVCDGVVPEDLLREELDYRRAHDKDDKSLEFYKFHVNALYVAMTRAVSTLTLVEAEVDHPIFGLLGLRAGELELPPPDEATASTKDDWAREARRLDRQGKAEQARVIRETILQERPTPWTPWSRELVEQIATSLAAGQADRQAKQALMDYALWHGQHNWIVQLAAAGFPAAKPFVLEGVFLPASYPTTVPKDKQFRTPTKRAVREVRHRLLQPYSGHTFRNVLKPCDLHGVDHRTPAGATPLMMAARAGNVALIEELLARGADVDVVDEFGQTAWLHAASRAMDESQFAADGLPAVFDRLAPAFIDLQGDQLQRIERHEAEYWLLTLMLAGLKTQWSFCITRSQDIKELEFGFKAAQLGQVLEKLPLRLWGGERRAPDFIEQVLERGRQHDDGPPDEKPWVRTGPGGYMPNHNLQLLRGGEWRHIFDAIPIDWIEQGTGGRFSPGQKAVRGVSMFLVRPAAAPQDDASAAS